MLQLLAPFWLAALSGVAIPIAIHLWNKKPGRTVNVGSIRWLEAAASQRLRSFRPRDGWLLLLRIALVACVAMLLTQPQWLRQTESAGGKWVLISPDLLASKGVSKVRGLVDSLRQRGFQLRRYALGFALVSPRDWVGLPPSGDQPDQADYWALLPLLARQPLAPTEAWIVTSNALRHFRGERPNAAFPVTWVGITLDEESRWLQEAFVTSTDSLELVIGVSKAERAYFQRLRFGLPAQPGFLRRQGWPPFLLTREGENLFVEMKGNPVFETNRVKVQREQVIVVFSDASRKEDVRYLRAALEALAEVSGRKMRLEFTSTLPDGNRRTDWLFWLSDTHIPPRVHAGVRAGMRIWKDSPALAATIPSTPTNQAASALFGTAGRKPNQLLIPGLGQPIWWGQTGDQEAEVATVVWKDRFGRTMLGFTPEGKGGVYSFAGRFHPQWNGLSESPDFPLVLGELLTPAPGADARDARVLDEEQMQPRRTGRQPTAPPAYLTDLRVGLGWLALLLFGVERVFSQKRKAVHHFREEKTA